MGPASSAAWDCRYTGPSAGPDCERFPPRQLPLSVPSNDVPSEQCLFPDSIWPWQSLAFERHRLPDTWAHCPSDSGHVGPRGKPGLEWASLWARLGEAGCGPPGALVGAVAKEPIPGEPENLKTGCGAEHSPSGVSTQFKPREQVASWPTGHGGSIRENWLQKLPFLDQPPLIEPARSDPNLAT